MAKVLIIDDSRFARLRLSTPIKEAGFDVFEAANGIEGLELTRRHRPDCIICDLLMPEMDGYGFLEHIKEEGLSTPVLILTSDIQEKTRNKIMDLGAKDLITKPPKYDEVIETLRSLTGG